MIDPAQLSAYIASRICHDLVSPVSSVTSALDFMTEPQDSEMRQQAETLLANGANNASARLQFLRYAFGSMGLSDGTADIHEAKLVTERFVATHKPSISFDIETAHLSYSHARLMMNLVMLALDCLPRGGEIRVTIRNDDEGLRIEVGGEGKRAKLREDTIQALAGDKPEDGWSARTVQPLFAKMIAEGLGGTLHMSGEEETVRITAERIRASG